MFKFIAAAGVALAFAAPTAAQTTPTSGMMLTAAWSRATPPGSKVAGGYVIVENKGASADRLVGGSSDIASKVEVHEMSMEQGVMRMRALNQGLEVRAGGKVELKPGGYHIMFIDLKRPLKDGETFTAEVQFEKAGKLPVTFKVMPIGASSPAHSHH